jgi:hypothetical protein
LCELVDRSVNSKDDPRIDTKHSKLYPAR